MIDDEDEGFDESEALTDDDVVELELDGQLTRCILLAVVEEGGQQYAVLQGVEDAEDPDEAALMVVRYDEDEGGAMRFSPLEDADPLDAIRAAIVKLLPIDNAFDDPAHPDRG